MTLPPVITKQYNEEKWGVYGELGDGANAKIRFLQTVIKSSELDSIKLISNIPGSEKWDVRDLFQRDVDATRVGEEIMPYLQDETKVKFFNPLTLILLPLAEDKRSILKELDHVDAQSEEDFSVYEKDGFYKLKVQSNGDFGSIEWNSDNCLLVAIDGQHRLSALKRWKAMPDAPSQKLTSWKIPVVLLSIYQINPDLDTANILEIVRRTFMYINKKAQQVNRSREILLNDESVNSVCAQELISFSHKNDVKAMGERDESVLPLIFYDWRGEVKNRKEEEAPASVKGIVEIHEWLNEYILGENYSDDQENELNIPDMVPPLKGWHDENINHSDVGRIREAFGTHVMPGLVYFLKEFSPYKEYISECRTLEKKAFDQGSDTTQFAFMKLRFGSHEAPPDRVKEVEAEYDELVDNFAYLKDSLFDEILGRDIGMRGVMYAFGYGRCLYNSHREEHQQEKLTWLDYAQKLVPVMNEIYEEGWFRSYLDLGANDKKKKILTHVIFDASGSIINYKINQAGSALGALLIILSIQKLSTLEEDEELFEFAWEQYSFDLKKTVEKDLRKSIRAELNQRLSEFEDKKALDAEVKKRSSIGADKYLDVLQKYLES